MKKKNEHVELFGWKTHIRQTRGTSMIGLNKIIVAGCGLEKGQSLYCYLERNKSGRKVITIYLDGKPGVSIPKRR